jgi:molybdopterin-guanine dinucleotide biosynthesis protein B
VEVVVASPLRHALVHELAGMENLALADLTPRLRGIDLLLVEGIKSGPHPKLEVWDPALGEPMLAPGQPSVVAIATDAPCDPHGRPVFARDDVEAIADFILAHPG